MLNGKFRGRDIGSGTDVWRFERGGPRRDDDRNEQFMLAETCMSRVERPLHDHGHRLDHGLPGRGARACSCPAAPPSRRSTRGASRPPARRSSGSSRWCGKTCGRQLHPDPGRPSRTPSGSTPPSAAPPTPSIHLLALAGRVGVPLDLDDFDQLARDVPTIVNLMPSGQFLMEDFFYAGGLPVVMAELGDLLAPGARHGDRPPGGRERRRRRML